MSEISPVFRYLGMIVTAVLITAAAANWYFTGVIATKDLAYVKMTETNTVAMAQQKRDLGQECTHEAYERLFELVMASIERVDSASRRRDAHQVEHEPTEEP